MTQISQKKENYPKNGYFHWKIKNFHKSKVDGLEKLLTRAYLFNDLMHFKVCPYINHKISCNWSCTSSIFLALHNIYMILVHMEVHSKYHLLMVDSFQIRSGVLPQAQDIRLAQSILNQVRSLEASIWIWMTSWGDPAKGRQIQMIFHYQRAAFFREHFTVCLSHQMFIILNHFLSTLIKNV